MAVPPEKSVYLQLQRRGYPPASITLEFAPGKHDIDGLWIDTTVAIPGMPVNFSWFLATEIQQRLLEISHGLAKGAVSAPFSVIDTDCSFDLTFIPKKPGEQLSAILTRRALWGGDESAVNFTIDRCAATYADVQQFVSRMSSIE